jgi:hypothetical protein
LTQVGYGSTYNYNRLHGTNQEAKEAVMAQSDVTIFLENLKLWDRPEKSPRGPAVLRLEDNVDKIVDEMFERFCDVEMDRSHPFTGNC